MAERSGKLNTDERDDPLRDETADGTVETEDVATELEIADEQKENASDAQISDDPDELREQIEETRRGMGETLEAIQEKLSISNISEQVKEQVTEQITGAVETLKTTVSDATIGKAGKFMKNVSEELKKSNFVKAAGENPLPLLLIGLGVGLLAIGGSRLKNANGYEKYRYRRNTYRSDEESAPEYREEENGRIGETAGKFYQKAGDAASTAYQSVTGAAGSTIDTVKGAAGSTIETVKGAAGSTIETVKGAAGDAYGRVGDFGGQLRGQYETQLEENPLVVGAVALAIGAAVGLAIPSTRYEGQLMGEARENLVSKAKTAARGAIDKVQEVVGQAKDTIGGDIQDIVGLAKDTIGGDIKNIVDQTKETLGGDVKQAFDQTKEAFAGEAKPAGGK